MLTLHLVTTVGHPSWSTKAQRHFMGGRTTLLYQVLLFVWNELQPTTRLLRYRSLYCTFQSSVMKPSLTCYPDTHVAYSTRSHSLDSIYPCKSDTMKIHSYYFSFCILSVFLVSFLCYQCLTFSVSHRYEARQNVIRRQTSPTSHHWLLRRELAGSMPDCSFCVTCQVEFQIVKLCAAMQWFFYLKGWSVSIHETK